MCATSSPRSKGFASRNWAACASAELCYVTSVTALVSRESVARRIPRLRLRLYCKCPSVRACTIRNKPISLDLQIDGKEFVWLFYILSNPATIGRPSIAFRLIAREGVAQDLSARRHEVDGATIGAGIAEGLGFGDNAKAALITRGLVEISRLAVAMGGSPKTLAGLAGMGDLVLTCTGGLSRNRQVGIQLAEGKSLAEIVGSMKMVAEGVETCDAAVALAQSHNVDLPIIQQMHAVLHGRSTPRAALRELMDRSLKSE